MKPASDYNRNVYLDILRYTRQDKELESRYLSLEQESRQLNVVLFFVIIGLILVTAMFWLFNKRSKVRNRIHIARLRQTLDVCQKITASIPVDVTDESEIVYAISESIQPDMEQLFGATEMKNRETSNLMKNVRANRLMNPSRSERLVSGQYLICMYLIKRNRSGF